MRIPPIFSALRRRTRRAGDAFAVRLMADYAAAGRCVRFAAEGFSPGRAAIIRGRKARRRLDSRFFAGSARPGISGKTGAIQADNGRWKMLPGALAP